MANPGKAKAKRLILAIAGSLTVNALLLGGLAWRAHYVAQLAQVQTTEVYLPPRERARQHTPKPLPPKPPPPAPPPVETPAAAPAVAAVPAARQPLAPPPAGTATLPVEAALGPAPQLKMGCLGQSPPRRGSRGTQCLDHAGQAALAQVNRPGPKDPEQENYAVLTPPGTAPGPPEIAPGVHMKLGMPPPSVGRPDHAIGIGISIGYDPEDKHFLPFQGSSVKHVFKPDEIYAVPTPMK